MMKKKVLLAALFSVTAVLAAVGLATEKTMAQGGLDDPFWMETGESMGIAVPTTVYCYNESLFAGLGGYEARSAINCASVSTGACTPYSPC